MAFRALLRILEMRMRVPAPGAIGGDEGRGEAENASGASYFANANASMKAASVSTHSYGTAL